MQEWRSIFPASISLPPRCLPSSARQQFFHSLNKHGSLHSSPQSCHFTAESASCRRCSVQSYEHRRQRRGDKFCRGSVAQYPHSIFSCSWLIERIPGDSCLHIVRSFFLSQRAVSPAHRSLPRNPQSRLQSLLEEVPTVQRVALQALDEGKGRPSTNQPCGRFLQLRVPQVRRHGRCVRSWRAPNAEHQAPGTPHQWPGRYFQGSGCRCGGSSCCSGRRRGSICAGHDGLDAPSSMAAGAGRACQRRDQERLLYERDLWHEESDWADGSGDAGSRGAGTGSQNVLRCRKSG